MQVFGIPTQCRQFRDHYTKAYRVLYTEGELGYIPEIFDAAQEAYPYIWVNGECYLFEPETVEKGQKLVDVYIRLIQLIKLIYLHSFDRSKEIPLAYTIQIKERLEEFDLSWVTYEKVIFWAIAVVY